MCKPSNLDEAFKVLDALIPERDMKRFRHQSDEDFAIDQQFELGVWERNTWISGADDATSRALFGDENLHPDTASYIFLQKYHNHLKRKK